ERPEDMPEVLHRLLVQRGIASEAEARAFLNPSAVQLNDPWLLSDIKIAVETIRSHVDKGSHICVYGDYDVDGVCASAILSDYFEEIGADYEVYLPSRHSEGYGLNEAAIREIAERSSLLITVDCGISSHDLIEIAKEAGLDCVVTDHHRPGDVLPECPVVNPLLNDYPFPWLCGAGVAFKMVHALGGMEAAMKRIDLAAIATVADIVALRGENRAIVHLGLKSINKDPRPGVKALMETARLEQGRVDSEAIGFRIAPRLNAGGRLGSARRSYDLLMQRDSFLALAQADELEQENARRQSIERDIRMNAEIQLEDFDFSAHRIIMVRGENWNSGVIGLAASHLCGKYHFPVIVFSENDGYLTGSCRSIPGVDIYETLSSAAHLMEKFGGHSQAAGLTIKKENFEPLQAALDSYLRENIDPEAYIPFEEYDIEASIDEFTEATVGILSAIQPVGCRNPEPIFRTGVHLIEKRAMGQQGAHLRLIAAQNGVRRTGVFFGNGHLANSSCESAEILFTPKINEWNGRVDVQLQLTAMRESDAFEQIIASEPDEGALQRRFLTELLYNRNIKQNTFEAEISLPQAVSLLRRDIQGTWIICPDMGSARMVLKAAAPGAPDLYIGRLSDEKRAFNAVCVCPDRLDAFPNALRTVIFAGMPVPEGLPEGVEAKYMPLPVNIWKNMPDVDQMREVFKTCVYLSKRPLHAQDMEQLTCRISEESGLDMNICHLSMLALRDMQLVSVNEKPLRLIVPPVKKTDPDSSAVWRRIQGIKLRMASM
ncbi:MAG: single-stranded-DNA-specific exonuclease RecJ, partial [Clostridia bacterium]|nr:single-stranded-DNA-specific exonuclease RecJ [Clostridia bacterium]